MKKPFFFVLILAGIIFFAGTDYFLNTSGAPKLPTQQTGRTSNDPQEVKELNLTQDMIALGESQYGYVITNRSRVSQLFEKVDLSEIPSIMVFQNQLQPLDGNGSPLIVYEVQGPEGQGAITYLNVKLKFVDIVSATRNINEISGQAQNSFFYNDLNTPDTAYYLVQIGDNLFGFQYAKADSTLFNTIKSMVNTNITQMLLLN